MSSLPLVEVGQPQSVVDLGTRDEQNFGPGSEPGKYLVNLISILEVFLHWVRVLLRGFVTCVAAQPYQSTHFLTD